MRVVAAAALATLTILGAAVEQLPEGRCDNVDYRDDACRQSTTTAATMTARHSQTIDSKPRV